MIRHTEVGDEQAVYGLICELENDTVDAEAFAVIYRELIKAGGMQQPAAYLRPSLL